MTREELISSIAAGMTKEQIAEKYDLSVSTVGVRIRKAREESKDLQKRNGNQKVTDEQLIAAAEEGLTRHQIAERYGIRYDTVRKRLRALEDRSLPEEGTARDCRDGGRRHDLPGRKRTEKAQSRSYDVRRMDTVVCAKDHKVYRVISAENGIVEIREKLAGYQDRTRRKQNLILTMEELCRDYEKAELPPVTCYIDPEQKTRGEE